MRVVNHLLTCDAADNVDSKSSLKAFRLGIAPIGILVHYAVTESIDATVAAQEAQSYYAHLSADVKNGKRQLRQLLPFNARGSHAGESKWKGPDGQLLTGLNGYFIGIEIANPGPLIRCSDCNLRTTYNEKSFREKGKATAVWPESEAIEARHSGGLAPKNWTHWAKYSPEELELLTQVCVALCKAYPIIAILGHDEVAPGRKFDPGPAFPMNEFREGVWQRLKS